MKAIMVFTNVDGLQSQLFAIICNKLARDPDTIIVTIKCLWGKMKNNHPFNFTKLNRVRTMKIIMEGGDQTNMQWCGLIGTGA
jgi:hypothetical protein